MSLIVERSRYLVQGVDRLCKGREVGARLGRFGHGSADAFEELDVFFAVFGVGTEEDVFVEGEDCTERVEAYETAQVSVSNISVMNG